MTDLVPLRIAARAPASRSLLALTLETPPEFRAAYAIPGQYLRVLPRGAERAGFFALSSTPGGALELLVKPEGAGKLLADHPLDEPLPCSLPEGKGFPAEALESPELWLLGMGSGVAPLFAALARRAEARRLAATHAYLGFRGLTDVPFQDRLSAWSDQGLRLRICLSDDEAPGTHPGRIQAVLRRESPDWSHSWALAIGNRAFFDDIAAISRDFALPDGRLRANF